MTRDVLVSENIKDYLPFFNINGTQIDVKKDWHPQLFPILFDLCYGWNSTSRIFSSPIQLCRISAGSLNFGMKDVDPVVLRLCDQITENLLKELDGKIAPDCRRILEEKLEVLKIRAQDVRDTNQHRVRVTDEDIWRELIKEPTYKSTLPELQKVCYVNLYAHYESFFVRCLNLFESVRVTDRDFKAKSGRILKSTAASGLFYEVYIRRDIYVAREFRNAVLHAGGRETPALKSLPVKLNVVDGHLQILPNQVFELFQELIGEVNKLLQFFQSKLGENEN